MYPYDLSFHHRPYLHPLAFLLRHCPVPILVFRLSDFTFIALHCSALLSPLSLVLHSMPALSGHLVRAIVRAVASAHTLLLQPACFPNWAMLSIPSEWQGHSRTHLTQRKITVSQTLLEDSDYHSQSGLV